MKDTSQELQKKEAETPAGIERTRDEKYYLPAVDIIEKSDSIVVVADVPGCDEKAVDITLEKNVLTINGLVSEGRIEGMRLALNEYGVGNYQRQFTLSDEIDREGIQAKVKNGVLTVILPKSSTAKTRKIAVVSE
ncbi:MAG: Hsp20/alpha crystallin family protein [Thermodesulfovibrionales bacterium]|nr:Hsp20/alpha crystallin family protein [Thermodesulfovibrionales bacterium]